MNKVILVGRLTKDPEVKYTPTGKMVASFTVAVNRGFTAKDAKQPEADFIPIVVWGAAAEFCGNYLTKGSKVLVDGRIQVRNYETKEGQRRYVTEVIASSIESLERKGNTAKPGDTTVMQDNDLESFGQEVGLDDDVPF